MMPSNYDPERRKAQRKRKGIDRAFYNDGTWRRIAKAFRHMNPLCAECERKGRIAASECVDHIVPIQEGGDRYAHSNMQALCNRCHASKSGREAHTRAARANESKG